MKEKKLNLKEWVEAYLRGEFDSGNFEVQCRAGWFDWFCPDNQLVKKTHALAEKLFQLLGSTKISQLTDYVFFKNNCPLNGELYDDFRICDIKTGEVIYTICPSLGYDSQKGVAEVWGRENDFKEPLVSGTWKDVLKFFYS